MDEILIALRECIVRFFNSIARLKEEPINEEFEFLRSQLEAERYRVDRLIDKLTEKPISNNQSELPKDFQRLGGYLPWHVKRQQLERDSRLKAEALDRERETAKSQQVEKMSIEELEKELGIENQEAS